METLALVDYIFEYICLDVPLYKIADKYGINESVLGKELESCGLAGKYNSIENHYKGGEYKGMFKSKPFTFVKETGETESITVDREIIEEYVLNREDGELFLDYLQFRTSESSDSSFKGDRVESVSKPVSSSKSKLNFKSVFLGSFILLLFLFMMSDYNILRNYNLLFSYEYLTSFMKPFFQEVRKEYFDKENDKVLSGLNKTATTEDPGEFEYNSKKYIGLMGDSGEPVGDCLEFSSDYEDYSVGQYRNGLLSDYGFQCIDSVYSIGYFEEGELVDGLEINQSEPSSTNISVIQNSESVDSFIYTEPYKSDFYSYDGDNLSYLTDMLAIKADTIQNEVYYERADVDDTGVEFQYKSALNKVYMTFNYSDRVYEIKKVIN